VIAPTSVCRSSVDGLRSGAFGPLGGAKARKLEGWEAGRLETL